jgi:hypothetical protein
MWFIKNIKTLIDFYDDSSEENVVNVAYAFLACTNGLKHIGFREEKEVRFSILNSIKYKGFKPPILKQVKTRLKEGVFIRYIEIFGYEKSVKVNLPISRIIVGPNKNKEERADSLRKFLKQIDLNIPVTVSEIPYTNN